MKSLLEKEKKNKPKDHHYFENMHLKMYILHIKIT